MDRLGRAGMANSSGLEAMGLVPDSLAPRPGVIKVQEMWLLGCPARERKSCMSQAPPTGPFVIAKKWPATLSSARKAF